MTIRPRPTAQTPLYLRCLAGDAQLTPYGYGYNALNSVARAIFEQAREQRFTRPIRGSDLQTCRTTHPWGAES